LFSPENPESELPVQEPDSVMEETAHKPKRRHRPLSKVLRDFAHTHQGDVSIANLRTALGDRSFAAMLVLFSSINLIPVLPPGTTLVLGIPPLIIAVQMILGHTSVWLPKAILNRSFSSERFKSMMRALTPRLRRVEHLIRPRYWPFPVVVGERLVGVLCALLSILVILPIPGANWIPAFAMVLMGLSLSQRDGILLTLGLGIGIGFLGFLFAIAGTITSFAHGFF
jgi:hypothetical protein